MGMIFGISFLFFSRRETKTKTKKKRSPDETTVSFRGELAIIHSDILYSY